MQFRGIANRVQFVSVALLGLVVIANGAKSPPKNGKPHINAANDFVVAELNKNFTITCEDVEFVEWWFVTNQTEIGLSKALWTNNFETKADERPYKSELILKDVNFDHMNLYFCVRTSDVAAMIDYRKNGFYGNKWKEIDFGYKNFDHKIFRMHMSRIYIYVTASQQDAPKINPKQDFVELEKYESINIKCEADVPIFWKSDQDTSFKIKQYSNTDSKQLYRQILVLENVTANSVATYFCIKETQIDRRYRKDIGYKILQDWVRSNVASKIHVFVNDKENLLAPISSKLHQIKRNDDLIIPCRPTMPGNAVRLVGRRDREIMNSALMNYLPKKLSDGSVQAKSVVYDPTMGFLLRGVQHFTEEVFCMSTNKGKIKVYVYLDYNGGSTDLLITSPTHHFATVGDSINLTCTNENPPIMWLYPSHINKSRVNISEVVTQNDDVRSTITVFNIQKSDAGIFSCRSFEAYESEIFQDYNLTIYDVNESHIYLHPIGDNYVIEIENGKKFVIEVEYSIYPNYSAQWYKNGGNLTGRTYFADGTDGENIYLSNYYPELDDSGIYILNVTAGNLFKTLMFEVRVKERPMVKVESVIIFEDFSTRMTCEFETELKFSEIIWEFSECYESPHSTWCRQNKNEMAKKEARPDWYEYSDKNSFSQTINCDRTCNVTCVAKNSTGGTIATGQKLFPEWSILILGFDKDRKIARGEDVQIACLVTEKGDDTFWYKSKRILQNSSNVEIVNFKTNYSQNSLLNFKSIQEFNSGKYECSGSETAYGEKIDIKIYDPIDPSINRTNLNVEGIQPRLGESLDLECVPNEAVPPASVHWYRNNVELHNGENVTVNNTKLFLSFITPDNEGTYACVVSNRFGKNATASAQLEILRPGGLSLPWIIAIVVVIVVLSVGLVLFIVRYKQKSQQYKKLKLALMGNRKVSNDEFINPDLPLFEQADMLPYDRRYDFPRKNLSFEFGDKLGSGAFGVVMQATAFGIKPDENQTIVAVKKIKGGLIAKKKNEQTLALISELKIMIHLGKHPNIVNLLGAVTEDIKRGDLMVIVEFCPYGSVRHVLTENRTNFINQICPVTNQIDKSIAATVLRENCEKITTTDLVSWACQVARAMDYLVSKRVLHGDLAARNVLLSKNNLVKICDFGLARKMVHRQYYRKLSGGYLPLEWLALESLTQDVFTKYSDIWSYGVMLWEFFSLGQFPYSGVKLNEKFVNDLISGYRLEMPAYANDDLYQIMQNCWRAHAETRPLFHQLEVDLNRVLNQIIGHKDSTKCLGTPPVGSDPKTVNNAVHNNLPEIKRDILEPSPRASQASENAASIGLSQSLHTDRLTSVDNDKVDENFSTNYVAMTTLSPSISANAEIPVGSIGQSFGSEDNNQTMNSTNYANQNSNELHDFMPYNAPNTNRKANECNTSENIENYCSLSHLMP